MLTNLLLLLNLISQPFIFIFQLNLVEDIFSELFLLTLETHNIIFLKLLKELLSL